MFVIFFSLISLTNSKNISITRENVNQTIRSNTNQPYFVWFWSPYCSHCSHFKPEWKKLLNESMFLDNVIFADVNCIQYDSICGYYNVHAYPTLAYMIPSSKTRIDFLGAHKFEAVETFLEKQVQFPALNIENSEEIEKYKYLTNSSSLFLLSYTNETKNLVYLIKIIAEKYRKTTARFFTTYTTNETRLIVYRERNSFIEYDGNFNNRSILSFIEKNLYPYLPPLSNEIFDCSKINGTLLIVFVALNWDDYSYFSNVAKSIPNDQLIYTYIDDSENYFIKYMSISKNMIPCAVMLNVKRNSWRFFSNKSKTGKNKKYLLKENNSIKINSEEFIKWCDEGLNNPNKIKWRGPGDGLFSKFLVQVYAVKAQGGFLFAFLLFLFSIVILIIIFVLLDLFGIFDCFSAVSPKYE